MIIQKLRVIWLLYYFSYSVDGYFDFVTEDYVPNKPTTIRGCTQRHKHLNIFDAFRKLSACDRLACEPLSPIRGVEAGAGEFPHIASIGWTLDDNSIEWQCGGIFITETFVLKAAHCTFSKGTRPDTVRLGEPKLTGETKTIKIKDIFKHPAYRISSHYNDLALVELNEDVKVNQYIIPACLWVASNFYFDKLGAAGWGADGYGKDASKVLTKVKLTIAPNLECTKFYPKRRKLQASVIDSQLCAGDSIMDTCQGDSGGPLEVNLYFYDKLIPFVVGITSFGSSSCGSVVPSIYTRVSSYIPWIQDVVNKTFDPLSCSKRNLKLRYDETRYEIKDTITDSNLGFSVILSNENDATYKCGGSVIDSQFVLTSASCLQKFPYGPNIVIPEKGENIKVASVTFPKIDDTFGNDLALVKLDRKIRFKSLDQLICPAPVHLDIGSDESGSHKYLAQAFGPKSSISDSINFNQLFSATNSTINIKLSPVAAKQCFELVKKKFNVTSINDEAQICAGYSEFRFPGFCKNIQGGPLITESQYKSIETYTPRIPYLVGVQSYGVECGFQVPTVSTNVATFIPWIDSVIYSGRNEDPDEKLNIVIARAFRKCISKFAFSPNFDPLVKREVFDLTGEPKDADTDDYEAHREARFENIVLMGSTSLRTYGIDWVCEGVIIENNFILTTARCVKSFENSTIKVMVSPMMSKNYKVLEAKHSYVHRHYSEDFGINDIALIEINPLQLDNTIVPACLWYNTSHLPYRMKKVVFNRQVRTNITAMDMNPIANEDCSGFFQETKKITDEEFCATVDLNDDALDCQLENTKILHKTLCSATCEKQHGESILHYVKHRSGVSTVVVGLSSATNYCDLNKPLVFTRVSAYREWIEEILKM